MAGALFPDFSGRKVAIVGLGKSNQALCRYLLRKGASLTLFDSKTAMELGDVYREFTEHGVNWSLGPGYLSALSFFDYIFLTPGMKKSQPEIVEAHKKGAFISTEIDLLLAKCKGMVAGVTGSAGKTTTASLAYSMLKESFSKEGKEIYLGGNIGTPLIEKVDEIAENSVVVLELSSFQLQLCHKSPSISLLLNIRPNHLDIHKDFDEYVQAKKNIFAFQREEDICILNLDDPFGRGFVSKVPGKVKGFTLNPKELSEERRAFWEDMGVSQLAWLEGGNLYVGPARSEGTVVAQEGDFLIPGRHNISNALGAILLSLSVGGRISGIKRAIRAFRGIEHRIEFVKEISGVRFYNDSIATSPDRTMALIDALKGPKILILGGYDKGLPFDDLAKKVVEDGCKVVTLGKTARKIEDALFRAWRELKGLESPTVFLASAGSLEEAVRLAKEAARPGYYVVLSPACASFDMFPNFETRGKRFKEIVERMAQEDWNKRN